MDGGDESGFESSLDGDLHEFLHSQGIFLTMDGKDDGKKNDDQQPESSLLASSANVLDISGDSGGGYTRTSKELGASEILNNLGNCTKISNVFTEQGIDVLRLRLKDIDCQNKNVSMYVFDAWAGSVLAGCLELTDRLTSSKSSVKNISHSNNQNDAELKSLNRHIEALEAKLSDEQKSKGKLLVKNQELEVKLSEIASKRKSDEAESKRVMKNLEQVNQELERRNRQKDVEIEKFRQKVHDLVAKDRETADKNRSTLSAIKSEIQKGSASMLNESFASTASINQSTQIKSLMQSKGKISSSNGSPNSKQVTVAEIVSALESEKKVLFQKIRDLETQNKELSLAFREQRSLDSLNNSTFGSDLEEAYSGGGGGSSSAKEDKAVSETSKAMFDKITEQEQIIIEQNQLIDKLNDQITADCERIGGMSLSLKAIQNDMDNMNEELIARPPAREFNKLKKELDEAQGKVRDLVMMRGEMAEINAWRSQLSTAERIKIDKRNHELGLWMIDSLPNNVMKEVLQSICRELDLSDVSEIVGSIEKLKYVVKSVPRMERFITQITSFVISKEQERKGAEQSLQSQSKLEEVVTILKKWWANLKKIGLFAEFHDNVLQELSRREKVLSNEITEPNNLNLYWGSVDQSRWRAIHPARIQAILRDLVDFQLDILKREKTVRAVDEFIRDRPEVVINKIVAHVQYLFSINSIEGLIPRMNQVYLHEEEMKTFITLCREELLLETAPESIVLAEVHRRLESTRK